MCCTLARTNSNSAKLFLVEYVKLNTLANCCGIASNFNLSKKFSIADCCEKSFGPLWLRIWCLGWTSRFHHHSRDRWQANQDLGPCLARQAQCQVNSKDQERVRLAPYRANRGRWQASRGQCREIWQTVQEVNTGEPLYCTVYYDLYYIPSNLWYKMHQIPKCFSSGLTVVFARSIEARC